MVPGIFNVISSLPENSTFMDKEVKTHKQLLYTPPDNELCEGRENSSSVFFSLFIF